MNLDLPTPSERVSVDDFAKIPGCIGRKHADQRCSCASSVWRVDRQSVERDSARPARVGKTHLGIGLGIKACRAGYPVTFYTATGWADRRQTAHRDGRFEDDLQRLLLIAEVGGLPLDAENADLFFQLIAAVGARILSLPPSPATCPVDGARSSPMTSSRPR